MNEFEQALRHGQRDQAAAAELAAAAFRARAEAEGLLDVAYTTVDSPVGRLLVARTRKGLVRLSYGGTYPEDKVLQELAEDVSPRMLEAPAQLDEVRRELEEYFEGRRTEFGVRVDWRLTHGFGRRVLRRTAAIPSVRTRSRISSSRSRCCSRYCSPSGVTWYTFFPSVSTDRTYPSSSRSCRVG